MSNIKDKENRQPYTPSFATKAAKVAVKRSITPTPNQIDKVVESVANATKRLSQHSAHSSSSKRKTENRIGPWRLGRTLGKGSTGRVRLAKHSITGQLAAIKIVPKNIIDFDNNNTSNNSNQRKKKRKHKVDENGLPYGIEREIIIMKLISHPNIMALYDVWENKNELYLVLEYVEGGELFDFLINNGRLNEKDAVKYFRMIINGVSYCHKFNICHRDLKPENILLDKNGKIKIADFGMAALETQQKLLETSCGSPHYASPEIVAGKNYHGSPSDVWSCGVILFALLTGHLPFDDSNIRNLLMKVQTGKFNMPSNLSNSAKDLIWSMLRVDPNERIKTEDIVNHPLMLKYPDNSVDKIEDELDHLDISKPVINIDSDIVNNLQTLWHGLPQSHIIKNLQNNQQNSEKMFYYLLENYKLTHMDDSDLSNITKSISKKSLNSKNLISNNNSNQTIPRSTSTIITTIQDESGKVLKSEVQKIQPLKSSSKVKSNSSKKIIASTSYNRSISFQRLRHDTSASTLSIVNMKRNLSIRPDISMTNLLTSQNKQPSMKFKEVREEKKDILSNKESNYQPLIIDNSDLPNSKSFTVNPKDLPDLPDLQDFKYLMNSIFDNSDDPTSFLNNKTVKKNQNKVDKDYTSKIDEQTVVLNIDDSLLSAADVTNETNASTDYYTSSLDPKINLPYVNSNKSQASNENTEKVEKLTKLEMLKKELSVNNPPVSLNHRNFSGLNSIGSSSTTKLSSFLKDEYKNVKMKDFNSNHKHLPSVSYSHKTTISTESKCVSNDLSDTSYSLHSAVEVRMMSPTEAELREMKDAEVFEDPDESYLNKNLKSDSMTKNTFTAHRNIVPNVENGKNIKIRNSLLNSPTNNELPLQEINENNFNRRKSKDLLHNKSEQQYNIEDSVFEDPIEILQPVLPTKAYDASSDSDITGSLYTTVEAQADLKVGKRIASDDKKEQRPFSELKTGVRESMTPTVDSDSSKISNSIRVFSPPRNDTPLEEAQISPVDPISHKKQFAPVRSHPYRLNLTPQSDVKEEVTSKNKNNKNVNNYDDTKVELTKPVEPKSSPFHKETKHHNWINRFISAFKKRPSSKSIPSGPFSKSQNQKSNTNNFSNKFLFKFNRSKYTPKSNIFSSEHWLESDIITKDELLNKLKQDSRTRELRILDLQETTNGCNLIFEVPNLKTTIRVEIVGKVGGEFGFGGCYIKFAKLKGTKNSFDYWCGVVRDITLELEKQSAKNFETH